MIDGVLACLYLGALWYAAPLLDFADTSLATRFRNLAFLGIGIPFTLAFVHLLYAPVVWIVVICLVFSRFRAAAPRTEFELSEAIALAVAVMLAWPAMVRPLLDGDTLLYHLPIAASWAQSHSFWTTIAPYWYYPPGSESFAAGMFSVAGRFALPLAGVVPAMMLVARLYEYARSRECSQIASGLIALAFIATPLVAFQIGTLQNDLWVAALFLEVLVAGRKNGALTLIALTKITGWVWGLIAAFVERLPLQTMALALIPLAVWIVHDIILLLLRPMVPIAPAPSYFDSTIAGHGVTGVYLVYHGLLLHSAPTLGWIAVIVSGVFVSSARKYALLGLAGLVMVAFFPVTFSGGGVVYAATGEQLRFALPALACGALVFIELSRKAEIVIAVVAAALIAWGTANVSLTFSNDAHTVWAPLAALLCVLAVLAMRFTKGMSAPLMAALIVILAGNDAQARALDFYSADMPDAHGRGTGLFEWLAHQAPPRRIVAVNMRPGLIIMSDPREETIASGPDNMCARATERGALLVIGSNEGDNVTSDRAQAKACGKILYEDGAALVVQP